MQIHLSCAQHSLQQQQQRNQEGVLFTAQEQAPGPLVLSLYNQEPLRVEKEDNPTFPYSLQRSKETVETRRTRSSLDQTA